MSALPPKADIVQRDRDVRFVPKCDIDASSLRQRICLVLIVEPPAERADFVKIKGRRCALGSKHFGTGSRSVLAPLLRLWRALNAAQHVKTRPPRIPASWQAALAGNIGDLAATTAMLTREE
jgi:hypothetical protein